MSTDGEPTISIPEVPWHRPCETCGRGFNKDDIVCPRCGAKRERSECAIGGEVEVFSTQSFVSASGDSESSAGYTVCETCGDMIPYGRPHWIDELNGKYVLFSITHSGYSWTELPAEADPEKFCPKDFAL
jgi:hypothetical protein